MRKSGALFAVLTLLAGCGGGETATDTTSAPEVTTVEPVASTAGDSVPVAAMDVAPCELVTSDDVAAATGLAVVGEDDAALGPDSCVFDVGVSADVFVAVDDGGGSSTGPAALFAAYVAGSAESISGLGEAAVYSSTYRTLVVDAGGGRYFAVGLSGGYPDELSADREILIALAAAAVGRIG